MKQAPLVQAKNLHLTFNFFAPEAPKAAVAQLAPGFAIPLSEVKPAPSASRLTPTAIGEYWPGQGGIYGGLRLYPEGLCHIIFAAKAVGEHAYGDHGTEVEAASQIDGRANTLMLLGREGKHPAAIAAAGYSADGHEDFYLPAISELYHGHTYLSEAFEKAWHVSSSQRSADSAYNMDFEGGWLNHYRKDNECFVRPVRRFLQ